MKKIILASLFVLPLAACGDGGSGASDSAAGSEGDAKISYTAQLIGSGTGDGGPVGDMSIVVDGDAATLDITLADMQAGTYAVHLHGTGKCEGPDFKTAGGHWNPTEKQHGRENPKGAHAGDLLNLTVEADGAVNQSFDLPPDTAANLPALLDEDGAAFMMHAKADDMKSDPAGDAGSRIVCGVIKAG